MKAKDYNAIKLLPVEELYEYLSKELSFNEMIELYRLIKHKIEHLEDGPIIKVSCYEAE